jgi:hypothetical protein
LVFISEDEQGRKKYAATAKRVAHIEKPAKLRRARNLGDLGPKDAPLLESLCRALLAYTYTVPALTRDAQNLLGKV